ncbi:cytochrome c [Vibrio sp. JC009]|uniref:c-type cytochrome n=1 Tax=Vibrio sp. JC009 TaxID=2912314 RepID=UPI0023B1D057|nr:cytochrome c [Vibrio sp. JC009]WED21166.1 cytochrome c [Vibrio sp. JC009]
MKALALGALIGVTVFSGSALAGDPAAGKSKSMICGACHGSNGVSSIDGYPSLKGQNEKYLVNALKAYKSKQRSGGQSALMQPQAAILSDQDIENLAAYYSSLK